MPPRRSGRKRKPNALYADDHVLAALEDSAEPEESMTRIDSDQDDEFQIDEHQEASTHEDLELDDGHASFVESRDSSPTPEADREEEHDSDVILEKYISKRRHDSRYNRIGRFDPDTFYRQSTSGVLTKPVEDTYSQGAFQPVKHTGKDQFINHVNGCDPLDVKPIIEMKLKWERNLSIPARKTDPSGCGGLAPSLYLQKEASAEYARNSKWLAQKLKPDWVAHAQPTELLEDDEVDEFYARDQAVAFIAEPNQSEKVHRLAPQRTLSLTELWSLQESSLDVESARNGWLINAGDRVQCLDWAPRLSVDFQYLALSCRAELSPQQVAEQSGAEERTSAFVAQRPSPSRVDIWEFQSAGTDVADQRTIANDRSPTKVLSLCSDFGPVRDLKWCPLALDAENPASLGLLAAIHADGFLRVFHVELSSTAEGSGKFRHVRVKKGIFNSRPPNTICTSVAWMSSSLIVAGCANGAVAVWDFKDHLKSSSPPLPHARPIIYHPAHLSYVLRVDSCGPSRPHLILSAAMDGDWCITDLRDPGADHAVGGRHRIPNGFAQWYEQCQGVISVNDLPSIGLSPVRRVSMFSTVARTDAPVSCMATSPVHSSMLIACADGTVAVTNPLRNWWKGRQGYRRYRQWWFKHDWRPGKSSDSYRSEDEAMTGTGEGRVDFENGLARLSCGYKLQDMDTIYRMDTLRPQKEGHEEAVAAGFTIHEPQAGVKALAWNCNTSAGGWASAGLGDGLVYIEDLSWS